VTSVGFSMTSTCAVDDVSRTDWQPSSAFAAPVLLACVYPRTKKPSIPVNLLEKGHNVTGVAKNVNWGPRLFSFLFPLFSFFSFLSPILISSSPFRSKTSKIQLSGQRERCEM